MALDGFIFVRRFILAIPPTSNEEQREAPMIRPLPASLIAAAFFVASTVVDRAWSETEPVRIGKQQKTVALSIGVFANLGNDAAIGRLTSFTAIRAANGEMPMPSYEERSLLELARKHWVLVLIDGAVLLVLAAAAFSVWRANRRLAREIRRS